MEQVLLAAQVSVPSLTEPDPATATVNLYIVGAGGGVAVGIILKLALTDVLEVMGPEQVLPVPKDAQAPPQPAKVEPLAGLAVKVTLLPVV